MNENTNQDTAKTLTSYAVIAFLALVAWNFVVPMLNQAKSGPDPVAKIRGPGTVKVGELVMLYGDDSQGGTAFEWDAVDSVGNLVSFESVQGTKNIRPSTSPGIYTFTLHVWNASKKSKTTHLLVVGGATPQPNKPDTPPVTPQPNKPDTPPVDPVQPNKPVNPPADPQPGQFPQGKYGAAKRVYDFALLVHSPTRPQQCTALAKACRAIAERIRNGELSALNPAVFEVAKELAELPAEWASFRSQIRGFLQPLYLNGQLKTSADLAILLEEAAVGLSAAEKVADNPK